MDRITAMMNMMVAGILAVLVLSAVSPAGADPTRILATEALAGVENPVLVRVLLAGETGLGVEQQATALEQSVRGLLAAIETHPEAVRKLEASRELRHLFKEDVVASSDAGFEIAATLADAGVALQEAGRTAEAKPVLELCIRTLAFVELRTRCALSLAATDPQQAVTLVINDVGGLNTGSSLVVLGDLAAEESLPEPLRRQAFEAIVNFTQGFKRMAGGEAAVEGLRRSGWPEAVPILHTLTKGFMNVMLHTPARRALLIDFGDRSIVPLLEKKAKRGAMGSTDDNPKWEAAQVLIEAGEPYGFEWARKELGSSGSDLAGPIVTGLATSGTPEALDILRTTKVKPGKSKAVWVALGLLQLGDASRADEVRRAMTEDPDDWRFAIPQMAVGLARGAGDGSAVPALAALYAWSTRQQRWSPGKIALAVFAGNSNFLNEQEDRIDWLNWVKLDMIDSLVAIGGSAAVPVLAEMLTDREPLIGASAALALTGIESPAVPAVLVDALTIDFGEPAQNRALRSEIAVRARARFGGGARGVLDTLAASDDASLRVLAAALE